MSFAFLLARRDLRGAWRRLAFVLVCLAIGVAAITAVGSTTRSVLASVGVQARERFAADLQVSGSVPVDRAKLPTLANIERVGGRTTQHVEFVSVVLTSDATASVLAEVKAVGDAYPLYGSLLLEGNIVPVAAPTGDNAYVEAALLARLGAKVGDRVRLGATMVRVSGVIKAEPDRAQSPITLGPRVLIAESLLPATELLQTGSRVQYRIAIRLPASLDAAMTKRQLSAEVKDTTFRVRTAEEAQDNVRRFITLLDRFLRFIALTALLLAGTGVAMTVRLHLLQRLDSLAILKALGARRGTLVAGVLVQTLAFAFVGSVLGVGIGSALQFLLPSLAGDLLPEGLVLRFSWVAAGEGVLLGLATAALFALAPVLSATRIAPLQVLRRTPQPLFARRGTWELVLLGVTAIVGALLLIQTIGSWRWGGSFIGGLLGALLLLVGIAIFALRLLARMSARVRSFAGREGLRHAARAPRLAVTVIVALALGGFLVLTAFLVRQNLLAGLQGPAREDQPNVYVIGVRKDQGVPVRTFLEARGATDIQLEPVVRGRVYAVQGVRVERDRTDGERGGEITREFGFSYRDSIGSDERLVHGAFWTDPATDAKEVSIEKEIADEIGAELGTTMTFDVQGVRMEAVVTSIRAVEWETGRPNYVFVFPPKMLADAPQTLFAALRYPPDRVPALQTSLTATFPNISSFDIAVALDLLRTLVGQVAAAISFLALFTIVAGLALLGGMVASTRAARVREIVILRALGARGRRIRTMLATEYAALGVVAALIALVLAEASSWALQRFAFELPWSPYLIGAGVGVLVLVALSVLTGVLTAGPLLRAKPLDVLRDE